MAPTLGKRKRQTPKAPENDSHDDNNAESFQLDAQEILKRHFEARFKPLPQVEKAKIVEEEKLEDSSEKDSEWDGISEDEEQNNVQIIEHTDTQPRIATMSKNILKSYMVWISTYRNKGVLTEE